MEVGIFGMKLTVKTVYFIQQLIFYLMYSKSGTEINLIFQLVILFFYFYKKQLAGNVNQTGEPISMDLDLH